jgi:hypothetical protein
MRMKQVGNKKDLMAVVVYNDESSASIPLGAPVCLSLSGTDDGLRVVLPSTGTDSYQTTFAMGVALSAIAAGTYGEAQVWGLCNNVKILRTRAASTDVFAHISIGALLKAESVSNCFVTAAANGASAFKPVAAIAQTLAVVASTLASSVNSSTVLAKAFIAMM